MLERDAKLAVYTTIYPAVLKYLPEWYKSVQAQTDQVLWNINVVGTELDGQATVLVLIADWLYWRATASAPRQFWGPFTTCLLTAWPVA